MTTISVPGILKSNLPLDITHHDSNEDLETECVNTLISFKTGGLIHQYFNQSVKESISKFENDIRSYSGLIKLEIVFCVVTHFKSDFFIDWPAIERHYHITKSQLSTQV